MKAAVLQTLEQANRLLSQGRAAEAAPLFAQLAEMAQGRDMRRQAAYLHMRAARSLAEAGNSAEMMRHALAALDLFAGGGEAARARGQAALARAVIELRAMGMQAEADRLQREVQARLGMESADFGAPPAAIDTSREEAPRRRLPMRCPNCGAPVQSDEVEWIDAQSAECAYCGSVVQAE